MPRPLARPTLDRRHFLVRSAGGLAVLAAPRRLFGQSPNSTLRVAAVGVAGKGQSNVAQVAGAEGVKIVALCDVDHRHLARASKTYSEASLHVDWRRMLDERAREFDAVIVSTPDHLHAPVAIAAMERGLHVYCEKPIAHDIGQCRKMAVLAEKQKLVTQMGTQIHSLEAYRSAVATVRSGAIGKVKEAHLWVSKSWAGPAEGRPKTSSRVPAHLEWDLWLGPAPVRPYADGHYHPARWRGWRDFGCGTLGDMGCHIFDPVFSALGLGGPTSARSLGPSHHAESFAGDGDVHYVFPGTQWTTDTLKMRWTDGSGPARPDASKAQLPAGRQLPGAGSFLVGEKGVMLIPHWAIPTLWSKGEPLGTEVTRLPSKNHYHEWAAACRGNDTASTPFSYSAPLTEAVLMGVVAGCVKGGEVSLDASRERFVQPDAQALFTTTPRKGW